MPYCTISEGENDLLSRHNLYLLEIYPFKTVWWPGPTPFALSAALSGTARIIPTVAQNERKESYMELSVFSKSPDYYPFGV